MTQDIEGEKKKGESQPQKCLVRPPSVSEPHYKFYKHLLKGGQVWRDDKLNNVQEVLTTETLGGDAGRIVYYGYLTLSLA